MRNRTSGRVAITTALALLATGCGDDDPAGPQESEISQTEAMALFSEILSAVFFVSAGAEVVVLPEGLAAVPQTVTIDETAPCQGGGTISLTGTYLYDVDDSGAGSYAFDIVETPNACGVETGSGETYVVNGAPNIQFAGSYSFTEGAPQGVFDMTFTGGMAWTATNGGTSGSCTVNLVYAFDWQNQTGSVQGSICGHNIDTTF